MSIESAKTFIERMNTDEEFAKKIVEATTAESRMELMHGEGYSATAEEIGQAIGELTDDELDLVTGGFDWGELLNEIGRRWAEGGQGGH